MKGRHRLSGWTLAWLTAASAVLSCNLPLPLVAFSKQVRGTQEVDEFAFDLTQKLHATLVDEEDQVLPLAIVDGFEWVCRDVDGAVSEAKRNAEAVAMRKLVQAEVHLSFAWDEDTRALELKYADDFVMVDPVLDGVSGEVVAWDTSSWSGSGRRNYIRLEEQGTLWGSFTVDERRQQTYPKDVVSQVEVNHNFFGLIPNGDPQTAYFCDLRDIPVPPELKSLTPENFGDSCPLYYYECGAGGGA